MSTAVSLYFSKLMCDSVEGLHSQLYSCLPLIQYSYLSKNTKPHIGYRYHMRMKLKYETN